MLFNLMALTVFICEYKLLTWLCLFVPFAVQMFTEGCALTDPFVRVLTSSGLDLILPSELT